MKRWLTYLLLAAMALIATSTAFAQTEVPSLSDEQMDEAFDIYFDLCSGCHGPTRAGATGPELTFESLGDRGMDYVKTVLHVGLAGGMPNFGMQGILSEEDRELMAAYLMNPVPEAPVLSFQEVYDTWNLIIPVEDRPTEPQTDRNWENFFGV